MLDQRGNDPVTGRAYYRLKKVQEFRPANTGAVPNLSVNTAKRADGSVTLMIINTNCDTDINTTITVHRRIPDTDARAAAWSLVGPTPWATNVAATPEVRLVETLIRKVADGWQITLPKHSLTAVEIMLWSATIVDVSIPISQWDGGMNSVKDAKECEQDRRKLIIGAGAFVASAGVLSSGVTNFISTAQASETTVYPYKKLDLAEVGRIAHETYFTKFCAETVITGIFEPLARSIGAPYDSFPLHSLFWAHGGMMGWGASCGTLIGAGMAVSLITGASKDGEAIINDVITYYANTELPAYKPGPGKAKAAIHNTSLADTPICHISVGKWMKKENVGFFTIQRNERCARLSADIAIYTARLLNEWADGEYKPRNKPLANAIDNRITSQTNCGDCHGDNVPDLPGID